MKGENPHSVIYNFLLFQNENHILYEVRLIGKSLHFILKALFACLSMSVKSNLFFKHFKKA